jgi:hypothetical protein
MQSWADAVVSDAVVLVVYVRFAQPMIDPNQRAPDGQTCNRDGGRARAAVSATPARPGCAGSAGPPAAAARLARKRITAFGMNRSEDISSGYHGNPKTGSLTRLCSPNHH